MSKSAVSFANDRRIHVGLGTREVDRSVEFYRILLGQQPTKLRPGYARFETTEPPLNLSLNETRDPTSPANSVAHFGIQVKTIDDVQALTQRFKAAGLATDVEEDVNCCYAVQNKVWVSDPDGNRWEVFVVLDDQPASQAATSETCCEPDCCSTPLSHVESKSL